MYFDKFSKKLPLYSLNILHKLHGNSHRSLFNTYPSQRKAETNTFVCLHSIFCRSLSVGHAWLFTKWVFYLMSINVDVVISYYTIPYYTLSICIVLYRANYLYTSYLLCSSFSSSFYKYAKWGLAVRESGFSCQSGRIQGKVRDTFCVLA